MKYCFCLMFVAIGLISALPPTIVPTVTNAPIVLPPGCAPGTIAANYKDSCKTFSGWKDYVVFDNHVYLYCAEGVSENMRCMTCAPAGDNKPLVFRADCNKCVYDEFKFAPCPTDPPTSSPPRLPAYTPTCNGMTSSACENKDAGQYPLEEANLYRDFYMCTGNVFTCMGCPSGLVYDKTCKACNWPTAAAEAYANGGHSN